jgi:hypothetical protein
MYFSPIVWYRNVVFVHVLFKFLYFHNLCICGFVDFLIWFSGGETLNLPMSLRIYPIKYRDAYPR